MAKKELKITCLNFEGFENKKWEQEEQEEQEALKKYIIDFIDKEEADIIAGQEFPEKINEWFKSEEEKGVIEGEAKGKSKFFTGFCIKNKEYNTGLNSYAEIEEIWEYLFDICSTNEYRSAYFVEKWIKFCGENIRLINVHISPTYEIQLKFSLLKYLSRLQNKYTIIMGDFNAAKKEQTEKYIEGNEIFLKKIESKGYIELLDEKEKNEGIVHYTHYVKGKGRKLDHIFVSKTFAEYFETTIEYDDDVNYTKQKDKDSNNAFTDHSAIKVIIGKK